MHQLKTFLKPSSNEVFGDQSKIFFALLLFAILSKSPSGFDLSYFIEIFFPEIFTILSAISAIDVEWFGPNWITPLKLLYFLTALIKALIVNKDRDIPGQYSGWISTTSNQTFYSNAGNMRFGGKKLRRKTYKKSHRKSSKKSHRKSRRGGKSRRGRR